MMHIYELFDTNFFDKFEPEVKKMFEYFTASAYQRNRAFNTYKNKKMFCRYEDKLWRVMGASRLGDIYLNEPEWKDPNGYIRRGVDADACSDFHILGE